MPVRADVEDSAEMNVSDVFSKKTLTWIVYHRALVVHYSYVLYT